MKLKGIYSTACVAIGIVIGAAKDPFAESFGDRARRRVCMWPRFEPLIPKYFRTPGVVFSGVHASDGLRWKTV